MTATIGDQHEQDRAERGGQPRAAQRRAPEARPERAGRRGGSDELAARPREPAPARAPTALGARAEPRAARVGDRRRRPDARPRGTTPTPRPAPRGGRGRAASARPAGRSRRRRAAGREQLAGAPQQRDRRAADADVAVEQQRGPPACPASGTSLEHASRGSRPRRGRARARRRPGRGRRRGPRPAGRAARRGGGRGRSRGRAPAPSTRSSDRRRRRRRAGPSQRSSGSGSTRPSARRSAPRRGGPPPASVLRRGGQQAAVEQVGAQRAAGRVQRARSEAVAASAGSDRLRHAASSGSIPTGPREAAAGRLGGDRARVLDRVDVAQRRQDRRRCRPRVASRARWTAPVSSLAHRDAVEHRAGRPRAARSPSSRRRARRRTRRRRALSAASPASSSAGRELRRVHADQEGGLADVGERRGEPLGEAVAALRDDLEAGRQPRAGRAVEDEDAPAGAARRRSAASSVSSQRGGAPAARPARACRAGVSRVLTRPGTGALAITRRAGP